MNRNTTIVLVVLFVLLAGYAYYTQNSGSTTPAATFTPAPTPPVLFDIVSDRVQSLEVRNLRDNRVTKVTRVGEEWKMELPANSAVNINTVLKVVAEVAHLNATRAITASTDLQAFGLITPTLQARLILTDTTTFAINLGAPNADKSGYYANYPGDTRIFVISASVYQDLDSFINNPPYPPTPTPTSPPTATPTATPLGGAPETTGTPAASGTPKP